MAFVRPWLLVVVLACVLMLRSVAAAPAQGFVTGRRIKCDPKNHRMCRPGNPQDPENQEEEAFRVNVKAPPAGGSDAVEDYNDADLPDDHELVVLGH